MMFYIVVSLSLSINFVIIITIVYYIITKLLPNQCWMMDARIEFLFLLKGWLKMYKIEDTVVSSA